MRALVSLPIRTAVGVVVGSVTVVPRFNGVTNAVGDYGAYTDAGIVSTRYPNIPHPPLL